MLRIKKSSIFTLTPTCAIFLFCLSIIISSFSLIFKKNKVGVGVKASLVLLFAASFVFQQVQAKVLINELQTSGISANDEFVELYNTSSDPVDISSWSIQYRGGIGATYYKKNFVTGSIIPAGGYFLIAHGGDGNYAGKKDYDMSWSQSLSSSGGNIFLVNDQILLLSNSESSIADILSYGNVSESYKSVAIKPESLQSIGRIEGQDTGDNLADFFRLEQPSPGEKNVKFEEKKEDEIKYPAGILFNEFYPHLKKDDMQKEYIELFNSTAEKVLLDGWKIVDYGKNQCALDGKEIESQKLLLVENDPEHGCDLALNDTGTETVDLKNPKGEIATTVTYSSAKEGLSYSFDGLRWRWTKFLTPAKENIFNNEPYGTLKIDDDVFVNVYANFSIALGDKDGDNVKVTWDFGDGHKSYLVRAKHKYEIIGKYNASVTLSDGSEDVTKAFVVEVKEFPHPKIKIVAIKANPKGSDALGESLTIQNKSKSKINLAGWSIATGTKKLANHPITTKFVLKKKQTREITKEFSKFALGNKKGKIELRYPDGEVADKMKYDHGKVSIEDDEVYAKSGGKWGWIQKISNSKLEISNKAQTLIINKAEESSTESLVISNQSLRTDENEIENLNKEIAKVEFENKLVSLSNDGVRIELLKSDPKVTGAETVREIDGIYFFTPQNLEQEHYAVLFLKNISVEFNSGLNMFLNYFSK